MLGRVLLGASAAWTRSGQAASVNREQSNNEIVRTLVFIMYVFWLKACLRNAAKAQRPGPRDTRIASATLTPGSLQRMIRPRLNRCSHISLPTSGKAPRPYPHPTTCQTAPPDEPDNAQ